MMKIHTTQNLSTLDKYQPSSNVSSTEFRLSRERAKLRCYQPEPPETEVTFGKKKLSLKNAKKIIKSKKDTKVEDIKEKAAPEVKKYDKFLNGKFFDKMLTLAENEPVTQATMSALICIALRPLTIMALPTKKDKQDNMYAASHAVSSGLMGLLSACIVAQPFKAGLKYFMKNMLKDADEKTLKRLYPHLDIKSIANSKGERFKIDDWKDLKGNPFKQELKDVEKIPALKSLNDISAETYQAFGADVNWAAYKGKSFNDVYTKDGTALRDALDWTKLGLVIEHDGKREQSLLSQNILLRDIDRSFMENLVKDAEEGSNWKNLNINSVYDANGKVVQLKDWKAKDGSKWNINLDDVGISSAYDTADYATRITGEIRTEKSGEEKYVTFLKNGKDGELGTKIEQWMVDADNRNTVHDKLITWLPDILTRPIIASATIALIPLILSNVFHIEKSSNKPKIKEQEPVAPATQNINENKEDTELNFKGKNPNNNSSKFQELFEKYVSKPLAKIYAKPLMKSEGLSNFSSKISSSPDMMSVHMSTLGSLLTSSVYMQRTINNKDLDADRRRTLAINQGLCFLIPTICAYTVNHLIKDWTKKREYRYSGLQERKIADLIRQNKGKEAEKIKDELPKKLKSVRTIAGLATFALIYRYITPVLITPVANGIGDKMNAKRDAKKAIAEAQSMKVDFNAEREAAKQTVEAESELKAKRA